MRPPTAVIKAALIALPLSGFGAGAASAGVEVHIDRSSQRMTVAVNGVHRYTWKVSTGKSGYATPGGRFQPFRMEPDFPLDTLSRSGSGLRLWSCSAPYPILKIPFTSLSSVQCRLVLHHSWLWRPDSWH